MKAFRSATLSATLLTGALMAPAKAELVTPDMWTGYYVGLGHALCGLLEEGFLSQQFTKNTLTTLAIGDEEVPQRSIDKAFEMLRVDETVEGCPLPPKR